MTVAQSHATKGNQVGSYLGHPIPETITNGDDTYVFDRIAEHIDGEYPLDQLARHEILVRPGLIYRQQD